MVALAETLEKERISHAVETSVKHKEYFGQYFTPYPIAKFMSSLFPATDKKIKLLDPGAGIGTLSCSFMERIIKEKWNTPDIHISAYDIDKAAANNLASMDGRIIVYDNLDSFYNAVDRQFSLSREQLVDS